MDIEWQEGAVCFAGGSQFKDWDVNRGELITVDNVSILDFETALSFKDFQLNTIKQGDFIAASELDTEQKFKDAAEVFGLFGFERSVNYNTLLLFDFCFIAKNGHIGGCSERHLLSVSHRKITFNQLMAIGALKRLEIKRDKEPKFGKNEDGSMKLVKSNFSANPNSCKDGGKYHREIIGLDGTKTTVDVYRILDAFKTGCSATDHAIKKMLCAGLRGHKDKLTDYDNAIESLQAAKELLIQKGDV